MDNLNLGIIPRAAQALFEKLDGPKHARNGSSSTGLRTPQRYSMSSASSLSRAPVEKNWQLKATYVEVRLFVAVHHHHFQKLTFLV
jgi:kinesin family protein 4/21/27